MIKKNRKKIEELSEASKVPLEHMFNSHDNSIAEWCFKTRSPKEGNTYNDSDGGFRCKNQQSAVQSPQEDSFPVSNR